MSWATGRSGSRGSWHETPLTPDDAAPGRVNLYWDALKPDGLSITAGSQGVTKTESSVAKAFVYVTIAAAAAAFLLWIWFVWADWQRIWNRLSRPDC